MKKIVIYILLFTTLSGIMAPFSYVNAQTDNPGDLGTCTYPPPATAAVIANNITYEKCSELNGVWTPNSANTPAQVSSDPDQTISTGACSNNLWNIAFGGFDFIKCLYQIFANLVYSLLLSPFAIFLGLAGQGLDYVIDYTVVDMATKINDYTGINIAWKLIRDLMNIFFIFILVYEAILLIIGQSSAENIGKFIGYLVLAALLVNFSLFFTKIMIDASNVVTIGIYNNIKESSPKINILGTDYGGMSVPFMSNLGLGKIFSNSSILEMFGNSIIKAIMGMIMAALFMFIAAIVFVVVAVMFVIRYIALLLLLMLSPIGFMGSALSFMKKPASQWWTALNSQLIFPPVYMLLTWVVLTLMESPGFISSENAWQNGAANSKIGFVMNFIIIIGLMIASLIISKDISTKGSSYIKNATGKLSAFAGGAMVAGSASLARNTIGRRYDRLAQDQNLKDRAAKGDKMAQARLATYRSIASTNFDAKGAFKAAGVDLGKAGNKGGYRGALEAKAEKEEKYAKSLKMTDYEKSKGREALSEYDKSEKSKAIEEEAKVQKFDNNAKIQEEFADKRRKHEETIRTEQADIKTKEEEITKEVKEEVGKIEKDVLSTEQRISELKLQLDQVDINSDPNTTGKIREELRVQEDKKRELDAELKDKREKMDDVIAKRVSSATRKSQGNISTAQRELNDIQKEYTERRNKVISNDRAELIARAGNPDKIKDHLGNEIQSHDATRISQYAEYQAGTEEAVQRLRDSIQQTASDASESRGKYNPVKYYAQVQGKIQSVIQPGRVAAGRSKPKNHEVAAKIRALNNKKTAKQLIDDAMKETGEAKTDTTPATPAATTPDTTAAAPVDNTGGNNTA